MISPFNSFNPQTETQAMIPQTNTRRATLLHAGLLCSLALALGPLPGHAADANPPERMTYQGFLVDANGNALGDPNPQNYDVVFRIWQSESSTASADRLWAEQQTVTVDKGYFSVLLGEGSQVGSEPRPALSTIFVGPTASDRWVGLTVKGIGAGGADSDILPRLRLLSSPYAFLARHAVEADRLVNGSSQQVVTVEGSRVGINQSSPSEALDVDGNLKVGDRITADRIYASRVNFSLDGSAYATVKNISGGLNPLLNFDEYDWLEYRWAQNQYNFKIGSATKLSIDNSGVTVPSPGTLSGYGTIPIGGIIMWSGSTIPDGWALCDGGTHNGHPTPNLLDRFVVGAHVPSSGPAGDPPYELGDTGGANTVTLAASQIPPHQHEVKDYYFAEVSAHGAGYYTYWGDSKVGSGDTDTDNRYFFYVTHNTSSNTGGGNSHENRPPYYALAFIMRVK